MSPIADISGGHHCSLSSSLTATSGNDSALEATMGGEMMTADALLELLSALTSEQKVAAIRQIAQITGSRQG